MNTIELEAERDSILRKVGPLLAIDKPTAEQDAEMKAAHTRLQVIDNELKMGQHFVKDPTAFAPGHRGDDEGSGQSLGQLFVKSQSFKEYDAGLGQAPSSTLSMSYKALFQTTDGWAPAPSRTGEVLKAVERPLRMIDLVPSARTSESAIVYMEETTFDNQAAETAEGGTMPESTLVYTERTRPIRKIAHTLPVTDEQMADERGMEQYLNGRMSDMLRLRVEGQLLNGDGTPPNLFGFLGTSNIQSHMMTAANVPDTVSEAMDLIRVDTEWEPDAVIFHPNNWQLVRHLKTVEGEYIFGHPASSNAASLWGKPVVVTTGIPEGTALVGCFRMGALVRNRTDVTVTVGYVGDQFKQGQKTIRCEIRLGMAIYRPGAFCQVTGLPSPE